MRDGECDDGCDGVSVVAGMVVATRAREGGVARSSRLPNATFFSRQRDDPISGSVHTRVCAMHGWASDGSRAAS
jgi:hypothetical protein